MTGYKEIYVQVLKYNNILVHEVRRYKRLFLLWAAKISVAHTYLM